MSAGSQHGGLLITTNNILYQTGGKVGRPAIRERAQQRRQMLQRRTGRSVGLENWMTRGLVVWDQVP